MNMKELFEKDERYHSFKGGNAENATDISIKELLVLAGVINPTDELIAKIRERLPAVREALDDTAFLESQIRGRLAFGVRRKEEDADSA